MIKVFVSNREMEESIKYSHIAFIKWLCEEMDYIQDNKTVRKIEYLIDNEKLLTRLPK